MWRSEIIYAREAVNLILVSLENITGNLLVSAGEKKYTNTIGREPSYWGDWCICLVEKLIGQKHSWPGFVWGDLVVVVADI